MSEFDPTREFHDELLSAYLDGELAPAERARVEERLAVDPVARQMLDELRSVSHAMQGLPQQSLSEDLSGAILSRAEESLRNVSAARLEGQATDAASSNGVERAAPALSTRSSGADFAPHLSIGRTRRGWLWAGLAVAAALVIMFVNRDANRDQGLPQLASRDQGGVRQSDRDRWAEAPELRALDDVTTKIAEAERVPERLLARDLSQMEGQAATAPPTPSHATTLSAPTGLALGERAAAGRGFDDAAVPQEIASKPLADQFADKPAGLIDELAQQQAAAAEEMRRFRLSRNGSLDGSGRALNESLAAGVAGGTPENRPAGGLATLGLPASRGEASLSTSLESEPAAAPRDTLVVNVTLKREALDARAIDQKLASHQIVLESTPAAGEAASAAGELLRANRESGREDYYSYLSRIPASESGAQETDLLLIEAPPARVEQLLADLDADAENVVSISVEPIEDSPRRAGEVASATGGRASEPSLDWARFNRVAVAQSLRESSSQLAAEAKQSAVAAATPSTSSLALGGRVGRGGGGGGGRGAMGAGRGGRRGRGRGAAAPADTETARQSEVKTDQPAGGALDLKNRSEQVDAQAEAPARSEEQQAESRFGGRRANDGGLAAYDAMDRTPEATVADATQRGRARRLVALYGTPPAEQNRFFDFSQPADANSTQNAQSGLRSSLSQPESGSSGKDKIAPETVNLFQFGGGGATPAKTEPPAQEPLGRGAQPDDEDVRSSAKATQSVPSDARVPAGPTMQVLFVLRAAPDPTAAATSGQAAPAATSPPPANPAK